MTTPSRLYPPKLTQDGGQQGAAPQVDPPTSKPRTRDNSELLAPLQADSEDACLSGEGSVDAETLAFLKDRKGLVHGYASAFALSPEALAQHVADNRASALLDPQVHEAQSDLASQFTEEDWQGFALQRALGGDGGALLPDAGPLSWKLGSSGVSLADAQGLLDGGDEELVAPILRQLGVERVEDVKTGDLAKLLLSDEGGLLVSASLLAQQQRLAGAEAPDPLCPDPEITGAIDVSAEQEALDSLGFGFYGAEEDAPTLDQKLRAFQEAYGLEVTGILDEATQEKLAQAPAASITLEQLLEIAPGLDEETARIYLGQLNAAMDYGEIDTLDRKGAFLAQVLHETIDLKAMVEQGDASNFEKYGGGSTYRGRGAIQLTHKGNYQAVGDDLGVDLVNNPDLVSEPEYAFKTAASFWKLNGCNAPADTIEGAGDSGFDGTSKIINLHDHKHLEDRRQRHKRVLKALQPKENTAGGGEV